MIANCLYFLFLFLIHGRLVGDFLQNVVISGKPFFHSELFFETFTISVLNNCTHRLTKSVASENWASLLDRIRTGSVTQSDIDAFHKAIGGILIVPEELAKELDQQEDPAFVAELRSLVIAANKLGILASTKDLYNSYVVADRIKKILELGQHIKCIDDVDLASLPSQFPSKDLIILCSERIQRLGYNTIGSLITGKIDPSRVTSREGSILPVTFEAEDVLLTGTVEQRILSQSPLWAYFRENAMAMNDLPPKTLTLYEGAWVSITSNKLGKYWAKQMKVFFFLKQ